MQLPCGQLYTHVSFSTYHGDVWIYQVCHETWLTSHDIEFIEKPIIFNNYNLPE